MKTILVLLSLMVILLLMMENSKASVKNSQPVTRIEIPYGSQTESKNRAVVRRNNQRKKQTISKSKNRKNKRKLKGRDMRPYKSKGKKTLKNKRRVHIKKNGRKSKTKKSQCLTKKSKLLRKEKRTKKYGHKIKNKERKEKVKRKKIQKYKHRKNNNIKYGKKYKYNRNTKHACTFDFYKGITKRKKYRDIQAKLQRIVKAWDLLNGRKIKAEPPTATFSFPFSALDSATDHGTMCDGNTIPPAAKEIYDQLKMCTDTAAWACSSDDIIYDRVWPSLNGKQCTGAGDLWSESHPSIWTDAQCPNLLNEPVPMSLEDCQDQCENFAGCTAINFGPVDGGCVLRGCTEPVPPPADIQYRGYYRNTLGWSQEEFSIWTDAQCPNLLNEPVPMSLEDCKYQCENFAGCTAINYGPVDGGCTLRGCTEPVPPPADIQYSGYYRNTRGCSSSCSVSPSPTSGLLSCPATCTSDCPAAPSHLPRYELTQQMVNHMTNVCIQQFRDWNLRYTTCANQFPAIECKMACQTEANFHQCQKERCECNNPTTASLCKFEDCLHSGNPSRDCRCECFIDLNANNSPFAIDTTTVFPSINGIGPPLDCFSLAGFERLIKTRKDRCMSAGGITEAENSVTNPALSALPPISPVLQAPPPPLGPGAGLTPDNPPPGQRDSGNFGDCRYQAREAFPWIYKCTVKTCNSTVLTTKSTSGRKKFLAQMMKYRGV